MAKELENRMNTKRHLAELKMYGFCIVTDVIPAEAINGICANLVAVQAEHDQKSQAELTRIRARGHRVGARGVGNMKQVINATQSFVPYLASRKIVDIAEGLFGPHVRISCTDCVVNHPGNERGYWHADWPYNQTNASHIPAPYADTIIHLSSIWMLTQFSSQTGGTFVIPGSHRIDNNPSAGGMPEFDQDAPYPTETQVRGDAGSVLLYDSRLWHAVAPNLSENPRVALIIRYAPWWLNLNPSMIGTPEHTAMVVETGGKNYESSPVRADVYETLPDDVKPLYRHYVR